MTRELPPEKLRRLFDPESLDLRLGDAETPPETIIGQKRAVAALKLGLGIREAGFNIYVAGPPGIGKMTAVRAFLEEAARRLPTPPDWVYVFDFDDPTQPRALSLPAGRGRLLQQDLRALIEHARAALPAALETDAYEARRQEILKALEARRSEEMHGLKGRAEALGLGLRNSPFGLVPIPTAGGKPLSDEGFEALPEAEQRRFLERRDKAREDIQRTLKRVRAMESEAKERLAGLESEAAGAAVLGMMEDLRERYRDLPEVLDYLDAVRLDILSSVAEFKSGETGMVSLGDGLMLRAGGGDPFRRYAVNLIVDNSRGGGGPVVVESNPSFNNLFGRVEKEAQFGAMVTDFTLIRAGSLHRANGGFLVLPVEDLLRSPFAWEGLKRCLRGGDIPIEDVAERLGYLATKSLRPAPVPLDLKIVLVGRLHWYQVLHQVDDEFAEFFKVKADFAVRMDAGQENIRDFLAFLRAFCRKAALKRLEGGAVAELLQYALRLAGDQQKLSMQFGALADIVREAHFHAQAAGSANVGAQHVRQALEQKVYRSSTMQERIQEMIADGTLLLSTEGKSKGQVNGLEIVDFGDHAFGKPVRITASAGPGRDGVVDIEREVELGGPLHAKGVLILTGYLNARYGQERPLSLTSRLVFEQSYEGVDGDSASSAELYALLSAVSGLPLRQDVAVTGSVNQRGEVQAIGGVNEKIEGFFDVCRARGLSGRQGAAIPESNVRHLMLRPDVVAAVAEGKFHIWPIRTVDEGIALLTGLPAARVHEAVENRLREMAESLKEGPWERTQRTAARH